MTKVGFWDDQVVDATYRRAGYLEYFSAAVSKVPNEIPHERGALLQEELTFAFVPRLLNPNKGIKNDRAKVERYTDYYFGKSSFSSFSLGHCEAYIDWGPVGMMLHLFCYGIVGGLHISTGYGHCGRAHITLLFFPLYQWTEIHQAQRRRSECSSTALSSLVFLPVVFGLYWFWRTDISGNLLLGPPTSSTGGGTGAPLIDVLLRAGAYTFHT